MEHDNLHFSSVQSEDEMWGTNFGSETRLGCRVGVDAGLDEATTGEKVVRLGGSEGRVLWGNGTSTTCYSEQHPSSEEADEVILLLETGQCEDLPKGDGMSRTLGISTKVLVFLT